MVQHYNAAPFTPFLICGRVGICASRTAAPHLDTGLALGFCGPSVGAFIKFVDQDLHQTETANIHEERLIPYEGW